MVVGEHVRRQALGAGHHGECVRLQAGIGGRPFEQAAPPRPRGVPELHVQRGLKLGGEPQTSHPFRTLLAVFLEE